MEMTNKDEKKSKEMYDRFGREYQKSRDEKQKSRIYNEFLEVPNMVRAIGKIKGKKLLDIGCGAGVHIEQYQKLGAKCFGIDISETLIELAKKRCPKVEFKIGSMTRLPYTNGYFDIATASLSIDYLKDLKKVFQEVNRVLKKGGMFYFSTESVVNMAKERYQDEEYKIKGTGEFFIKKLNKNIILGNGWKEGPVEWEMLPGMKLTTYNRPFRNYLLALREAGFELADLIDCKPEKELKKYDTEEYEVLSRIPFFSIYVLRKK
jgi:ubiquinone/menaquinone biosynthesis C-methylase UbiE